MKSLINRLYNFIDSIENSKTPIIFYIITFLAICNIRNFSELAVYNNHYDFYSSESYSQKLFDMSVNFTFFFINCSFAMILIFYSFIRKNIDKIFKIVFSSIFFVVLGPIFDKLFFVTEKGLSISFLFINKVENLIPKFFGFLFDNAIPPGIRLEISIILLFSFIYVNYKTKSKLKAIFSTFITYFAIFFFYSFPFFAQSISGLIKLIFNIKVTTETAFLNYMFLIFFIFLMIYFYILKKDIVLEIIKDIRPFRLVHFNLMFVIGFLISSKTKMISFDNSERIFYFIYILISISFAWIFSVITNNFEDIEIDRISNSDRPLFNGKIDINDYKVAIWITLAISLFYAFISEFMYLVIIFLFIGNYFLYSMKPLKLKRIPVFSKFIIAMNSYFLFSLGFVFNGYEVRNIPTKFIIYFAIFFTLAINVIDIKDYFGDKENGIITVPVLLGLKFSKILIGLFFVIANIAVYYVYSDKIVAISLFLFSIAEFVLINKKDYKDKYVFGTYVCSLISFSIYLIFF